MMPEDYPYNRNTNPKFSVWPKFKEYFFCDPDEKISGTDIGWMVFFGVGILTSFLVVALA